jgi:hypothetical protein
MLPMGSFPLVGFDINLVGQPPACSHISLFISPRAEAANLIMVRNFEIIELSTYQSHYRFLHIGYLEGSPSLAV